MRVKLSHCIRGRMWLGQDIESHKPVYVNLYKTDYKTGDIIEYYLTDLGEHWEIKGGTVTRDDK